MYGVYSGTDSSSNLHEMMSWLVSSEFEILWKEVARDLLDITSCKCRRGIEENSLKSQARFEAVMSYICKRNVNCMTPGLEDVKCLP